ncbi:unnamed protein product [Brachionus calyciflorus]|uniref:N-acetyl-D-glucosamine kinase n=1 Tax=Brachionus calyciflorus TaxID=104777 RepID=A0A813Q0T3_9BILA|nr:unnamed protein product [Brachionus calyciflorus]
MSTKIRIFGGIEGGATKTICKLLSENGEILASENGGPTNPWTLGIGEKEDGFKIASLRLYDLILKCMDQIGPEKDSKFIRTKQNQEFTLAAVGLCLSGAGCKVANARIKSELENLGLDCEIYVGNDTIAPIFNSFENGGLVIISGTGSKCVLVNPIDDAAQLKSFDDIPSYSSGGWGNLLGDEGSAYWIAQKAIKFALDYNDNFLFENCETLIEQEAEELKHLIFEHFNIDNFDALLPYFYSDFKKDFIAGLTAKLSKIAIQNEVVREIFEESGYQIARHILALQPKIDKKLFSMPGGLPIFCAGSVFKSWSLIKPGFVRCLVNQNGKFKNLKELNLVVADGDSTVGACLITSKLYDNKLDLIKTHKRKILTLDHFYISQFKSYNYCGNDEYPHSIDIQIPKEA